MNLSRRRCSFESFRDFRSLTENFPLFEKPLPPSLSELVSMCRKKNNEAKLNFKKSLSYIFFRYSIELFSAFCRIFFDEVVKTAFYVSIATFWKKNAESFLMLGKKPSAFCDKLFDRVVKTAFQVYMGTSWAEKLSDENLTFSCSHIERKVFTFVRKFFWLGCQNCIPPGKRIILRRSILFVFFPYLFRTLSKKCSGVCRMFINWVVKTAFFVSRSVLCVDYLLQESCTVLFITFGLSDKKICSLAEK